LRDEPIKVEHPLAKGSVGTGFIVMQRVIGVDQVHVSDFAVKPGEEFESAAGQRFLLPGLSRSDCGTEVRVAGVKKDTKVVMAHVVHQLQDFGGLIECKPRFELPHDPDAALGSLLCGHLEGLD
jgi:hypothetical protein